MAAWRSRGYRAVSSAAALLASMALTERPPPRMPGTELEEMPPTGRCPTDDIRLKPDGNGIFACRICGRRFREATKPN